MVHTESPEDLITATRVRRRFGNISDMTLWRWLGDTRIAFPRPLYIGQRRYWRLSDLAAWEAKQRGEMPVELDKAKCEQPTATEAP